ncbi:STAS domain-containing protein [Streptomyces argyrophyllae]|uniref:Anti-sigma factor antagonist n=1 Tax=Streptomyces argyrophylli TaxID=2726118 RepID=A0A6M4PBA1_9ACTN|nr:MULTISPECIES: STAS domain-containing protein [Streptomyces]QJS08222.1 STAS domain-containing protein [Streptomyces argyrophyllae]
MNETGSTLAIATQAWPTGPVVLRVAGELDHHTGPRLRQTVEEVLRGPGTGIVADLSELEYCDSTGVTVLITACRRAEALGSSFSVARLSPAMTQLFRVVGLDQMFTLHSSVEEAVEALNEG